jgi:hypothetical protein
VKHTVYYPDAASILQRAQAAVAAHWSGIVIWALGYEDSSAVLTALAGVAPQRPNGNPTGSIDSATQQAVTGGTKISVTGWAADPEFDLPVPVTISIDGTTAVTTLARVERPDVAAAYPGIGPFHGFDVSWSGTLSPGDHQVCLTLPGWVGQTPTPGGCQVVTVPSAFS